MKYQLVTKTLYTYEDGFSTLNTSVNSKKVLLKEGADGNIYAMFLEPVKDWLFYAQLVLAGVAFYGILLTAAFFFAFCFAAFGVI